jgi:hypothetical protein
MNRVFISGLLMLSFIAGSAKLSGISARPKDETQPATADKWKAFQFLFGTWSGEGLGPGGKGPGTLTVEPDLDGTILKAVNNQNFPGNEKQPPFTYRGMMIVSSPTKALFVDNEGHVLHYTVRATPNKVVFTGEREAVPVSPRFRFSYALLENGKLDCSFDIAPMGTPDKFSIHVGGTASRKQ